MAYPGFQRGGCLRSDPIRKGGGGGGGGAVHFRSYTKSEGGRFRSDIRKVGGGAIPLQVRYLWAHRKFYMYLTTCYLGILHTRQARSQGGANGCIAAIAPPPLDARSAWQAMNIVHLIVYCIHVHILT